ncbi:MAG: double zinc ribbon domain-containing protein [Thermoleophilia bacterium]
MTSVFSMLARCIKCSAEVKDNYAFCSNCGEPLPENNPPQLTRRDLILKVFSTFRTNDPERIPNVCAFCQAEIKDSYSFCGSCGKTIQAGQNSTLDGNDLSNLNRANNVRQWWKSYKSILVISLIALFLGNNYFSNKTKVEACQNVDNALTSIRENMISWASKSPVVDDNPNTWEGFAILAESMDVLGCRDFANSSSLSGKEYEDCAAKSKNLASAIKNAKEKHVSSTDCKALARIKE